MPDAVTYWHPQDPIDKFMEPGQPDEFKCTLKNYARPFTIQVKVEDTYFRLCLPLHMNMQPYTVAYTYTLSTSIHHLHMLYMHACMHTHRGRGMFKFLSCMHTGLISHHKTIKCCLPSFILPETLSEIKMHKSVTLELHWDVFRPWFFLKKLKKINGIEV